MMRDVDELFKTKVCRPVSRCLSVIERVEPLWNTLTHKVPPSEIPRHSSETEQIRTPSGTTERADSRFFFFLIRDSETRGPGRF